MATHKLWSPMSMMIAVLLPTAKVCSQDTVDKSFGDFDTVRIAALALGLEIEAAARELRPPPSKGFKEIVQLRPERLVTPDAGESWLMRLQNKKDMLRVNPNKYKLGPADLGTANTLLAQPYLAAWVTCMQDAWAGRGSSACILKLADDASKQPETRRKLLLANLGARLLALSDRNKEWHSLIYGAKTPRTIGRAVVAYRELEREKIKAVYAHGGPLPHPGVLFVKALEGTEVSWKDFVAAAAEAWSRKVRHPWGTIIPWSIDEGVGVQQYKISPQEASICTLPMSANHHVILKGKFDNANRRKLEESRSINQLIRNANASGIKVFLSRPGSSVVGVCNR